MDEKIKVEAQGAEETFKRWLDRGDAIGAFQNQDLSSNNCGHQIFLRLKPHEADQAIPGKDHAPDGSYGLGWRYLLSSVERSLDRFEFIPYVEPVEKPKRRRKKA